MDGWKNRTVNALYGARGNSLFDQPMKLGGGLFDMTTADVLNTPIARGSVLPLTEYVNRAEFDTDSGLFGAIKRAATAPGRAYSGQIPEGQMIDEGMNFAGMLSLGGYMGAPLKPASALGSGGSGKVRMYHGTSDDAANSIVSSGKIKGYPNAFVSDRKDIAASYGGTVVPVDVDKNMLRIDPDLSNSLLLTVDEANGYFDNPGWTIDDYLQSRRYSFGVEGSIPLK